MMAHSSRLLIAPQRLTRPLQPHRQTLRFWCLTPKGRGIEYDRLRGSDTSRGSYLLYLAFYVWYTIMHSCLLSCIELYLCDSDIYMMWYLCDMWHVCSLLWIIYMSYHLVMLIFFASAFYSDANKLYYLYSCLFYIFWVHHVGLGHISLSNFFVLIDKGLYEPSMLKPNLFHILEVVLSSITKKGEIESI